MIGSSRYDIPANWPQPPVKNKPGDVPGPPVQYGSAINPDDVEPGYGYSQPIPLREDDCNIYVRSQEVGERVQESVSNFIESKLKLILNKDKSQICEVNQTKFLGY